MLLILGGSGYIGNYLFHRFTRAGYAVTGTYSANKMEGMVHFDLAHMRLDDIRAAQRGIRYVVISAAAKVNLDDSKRHWEYCHHINVVRVKDIIDYSFHNAIVPIYLSTDNVFDGREGKRKETDVRNPINCYGQIRYDIENYLLDAGKECIILRMGRVFGGQSDTRSSISNMIRALCMGKTVICTADQVFSPLYIEELFDSIRLLMDMKYTGVMHVVSIQATTHYEIAKSAQVHFDCVGPEIVPCNVNSLGLLEKRPLHVDLDDSAFQGIAGVEHREIEYYLSRLRQDGVLSGESTEKTDPRNAGSGIHYCY